MKIIKNKAQCLICMDIIESKSVHDFVSCRCGNIFVDGGHEYLRAGATNIDKLLSLSETEETGDIPDRTKVYANAKERFRTLTKLASLRNKTDIL